MRLRYRSSILLLTLFLTPFAAFASEVRVGSKAFTEGFLLGELAAQTIEEVADQKVVRKFGLGSTGIVLQALMNNEIDVYPEYTGTISEAVLHDLSIRHSADIQQHLKKLGLVMSRELGFQNTYALAVRRDFAEKNQLRFISDLRGAEARVRTAFSHEFIARADGVKSLEKVYGLKLRRKIQAVDHSLAYQLVASNKADMIAVYSTDDMIEQLDLVLLVDDKEIFAPYKAVFLAKNEFVERQPEAWAALNSLAGTIDDKQMRKLNGEVERKKQDFSTVIASYLGRSKPRGISSPMVQEIKRRTAEHLFLVGVAMLVSIFIGIPLGIISSRFKALGQILLLGSAVVQTVPSLALLALLIPVFGIGMAPALVALCLYSLLPVLLNTSIGLQSINPELLETARALGLSRGRILFWIELPMASRNILGGLRTAAIIGIGTATLAALIGAGGYGAPIVSGLATNNMKVVLSGAIPCALLALLTYALFEVASRFLIPRGLRS